MKIDIDDKYQIASDDQQFTLYRISTVTDKESKNFGKKTYLTIGHYLKIEHAIDRMMHLKITDSTAKDLQTLSREIQNASTVLLERIESLRKPALKKSARTK